MEPFVIMTDSSSNLTPDLVKEAELEVIPLICITKDGKEMPCYNDQEEFDGHAFYDALRQTGPIKTSMISTHQFASAFKPIVSKGRDILYIAMSSGISGTCAAAKQAAEDIMKKYPGRVIRVVDTLGASFGEGMFALMASTMRAAKQSLQTVTDWVENNKRRMCQFFTVDDLTFLQKGGRISAFSAKIGTLANIKPLLIGDSEGKIVSCGKVIGRKKSLQAIADLFDRHAGRDPEDMVAIAHSDCEEDVNYLVGLLRKKREIRNLLVRCYEPGTGSHVGPGAVALFFMSPQPVK